MGEEAFIDMYETAFSNQPESEELGRETLKAYMKTHNFLKQNQCANKLYKAFGDSVYYLTAACSSILQVNLFVFFLIDIFHFD